MRNNHGITITELAVVVIIMLIIAGIAVISGRETLNQADVSAIYSEMTSMKNVVNSVIIKQGLNDNFVLQEGLYYDTEFTPADGVNYSNNVLSDTSNWYIIYGIDENNLYEKSDVKATLGLDSISHTYIVNYQTAEIELYKPLEVAGRKIRTYEQVRNIVEGGEI